MYLYYLEMNHKHFTKTYILTKYTDSLTESVSYYSSRVEGSKNRHVFFFFFLLKMIVILAKTNIYY